MIFLTVLGALFACDFFSILPLKTVLSQLRVLLPVLYARPVVSGQDVLTYTHTFRSRVWPGDTDIFFHKNNVKYLERCEVGRFSLMQKTGLASYLRCEKIHLGFSGINLRWRRELKFLQSFVVESRFAGWDERCFYIEQRFVDARTGFVHCQCHSVCKLASRGKAANTTPAMILKRLSGLDDVEAVQMDKGLVLLSDMYNHSSAQLAKPKSE